MCQLTIQSISHCAYNSFHQLNKSFFSFFSVCLKLLHSSIQSSQVLHIEHEFHAFYRGYYTYTVVRTCEVYLQVEKIFHSFAALTREIFLPQEDKLHMFKPTCNFLFITYILDISVLKIKKLRKNKGMTSTISPLVRIWRISQSYPGCSFVWKIQVVYFSGKHSCLVCNNMQSHALTLTPAFFTHWHSSVTRCGHKNLLESNSQNIPRIDFAFPSHSITKQRKKSHFLENTKLESSVIVLITNIIETYTEHCCLIFALVLLLLRKTVN